MVANIASHVHPACSRFSFNPALGRYSDHIQDVDGHVYSNSHLRTLVLYAFCLAAFLPQFWRVAGERFTGTLIVTLPRAVALTGLPACPLFVRPARGLTAHR